MIDNMECEEHYGDINSLLQQIEEMENNHNHIEKMFTEKIQILNHKLSEKQDQYNKLAVELSEIHKLNTQERNKIIHLTRLCESDMKKSVQLKNKSLKQIQSDKQVLFHSTNDLKEMKERKHRKSPKNSLKILNLDNSSKRLQGTKYKIIPPENQNSNNEKKSPFNKKTLFAHNKFTCNQYFKEKSPTRN